MKFTGASNFMFARRASMVETSVPSGRGTTDIPMVTNPRLTTLPMTKPTIAAKMFLAMGFMIKKVSLVRCGAGLGRVVNLFLSLQRHLKNLVPRLAIL